MRLSKAASGRALDRKAAAALIDAALDDAGVAPRRLSTKLLKVHAKVRIRDLRRIYATVITVDKSNFALRLFKRLRFSKRYGVAVGQSAYPTPSGLFSIVNKQVDPVWSVPNSPWAGELQGTTVQGGSAANPLKARWMGIVNGVGIHGTGDDGSIGSRASHGCIRMHVWDVIDLYRRVPVGTRVLIR
jgi:lipoprotein-anchoring transpeptidase ErfK/SrfK